MTGRPKASEHPLKGPAIAVLVLAMTVTFLAAFVYLLVFHTFVFLALLAAIAALVRGSIELARWRFARANEGRTFLLFTRRHGWHEFVTNNVEPVLATDWTVVWYVRPGLPPTVERHPLLPVLYRLPLLDRPVAIRPTGRRLEFRPLREALQPLKSGRGMRRDPAIQAEVRRILEQAFESDGG